MDSCLQLLGIAVVAILVVRVCFRPPRFDSPPDVSVRVGESDWQIKLQHALGEQGYAHVPGLLDRVEAGELRRIAHTFCYGTPRKALPLSYGGYSVPNFLGIPAFEGAKYLVDDPRIQEVMTAIFNDSTAFRFASHNDVGCDFVGVWHKDILRGSVAKYQECGVFSPDSNGESHDIFKVLFYLQDHDDDEQATKVIPGSHRLARTPWELGYVAVHPRLGDAVIIDQRISHAGNSYYNLFGEGRLFVQIGFGRRNRFTDEFERGTVERQQRLQRKMLSLQGGSTFWADVKFTALGLALYALPPQVLNYFADADVPKHVERRCSDIVDVSNHQKSEL